MKTMLVGCSDTLGVRQCLTLLLLLVAVTFGLETLRTTMGLVGPWTSTNRENDGLTGN
jgi:hypothetical protein